MGKKYIIEFSEDPHTIRLMKIKNGDKFPITVFKTVEPYIEPDLEQIRKEAYDKGFDVGRTLNTGKYEKGLNDAWEAARKIYLPEDHGGLGYDMRMKIFNTDNMGWLFKNLSASEAIEKIRQYEQEQEYRVGDEFENGTEKFVVLKMDGKEIDRYIDGDGKTYVMKEKYRVMRKTGRSFPEIAAVLEKMRGEQE